MASSSPAHPDSPITLKVSFNGNTRRITLPLGEVSSTLLLTKVRHDLDCSAFSTQPPIQLDHQHMHYHNYLCNSFLCFNRADRFLQIRQVLSISPDANAVFERHSDSAAAYVELDPNNTAVWKQLSRAAKAKRKLKLRVTLHDSEEDVDEYDDAETTGPKPVTVEDEPEQQTAEDLTPVKTEAFEVVQPVVAPAIGACWAKNADSFNNTHLEQAMSDLHLESDKHEQDCTRSSSTESTFVAPKTANFAVCCNNCDRTIPDAHYHCSTCDNGDFDLCPPCVELGITCHDSDHWLLKRFVRGDFILVSTTERVSPKPKIKEEESDTKPIATLSAIENAPKSVLPSPICAAPAAFKSLSIAPMRTCNSCVQELPDKEFLHCLSCDDFDLCKACFTSDKHGHHPPARLRCCCEGHSHAV